MADTLGFQEAERLLRDAEFADCKQLWYSSNYVYLAQLTDPGGQTFAAVYKPLRGESPLWDFPEGHLYRHEAAAYELAQLLNWRCIPPTIVRDGPHGIGSVQVFIRHDPEQHFFVQREVQELVPQLQRMSVFDVLANNADRKGGHCLLDEANQIWGIDHGLCFHPQYKLRSVIWDWAGEPVPDDWLADAQRAAEAIVCGAEEASALTSLLAEDEVGALVRRAQKLLEERRFPMPGPNRHYPWPLV